MIGFTSGQTLVDIDYISGANSDGSRPQACVGVSADGFNASKKPGELKGSVALHAQGVIRQESGQTGRFTGFSAGDTISIEMDADGNSV